VKSVDDAWQCDIELIAGGSTEENRALCQSNGDAHRIIGHSVVRVDRKVRIACHIHKDAKSRQLAETGDDKSR